MDDARHTWNNQAWVISELVAALHTDQPVDRLGQRFLDGIDVNAWQSWELVEEGVFLALSRIDPARNREDAVDVLAEFDDLSVERLNYLIEGGMFEADEISRWREYVVECAFDSELATFWCLIECKPRKGRGAFLAATTPTQPLPLEIHNASFAAASLRYSDAKNALKGLGFLGPKDYRDRAI
jgi:hypothetical protein